MAANPRDTIRLRIDEEARTVEERLRETALRTNSEFRTCWAVRQTDLTKYLLLDTQPTFVHFSGHGSSGSEIVLEDNVGDAVSVPFTVLSDMFRIFKDKVRCVVLNACWSDQQARAIAEHIDCVVGMSQSISDKSAVHFAAGFYRGIGFGRSVQTAFELGRNELSMVAQSDYSAPQLLGKKGVDLASLFLHK